MARERILIADDEPNVLELCQRILKIEGYQVETARTGHQALERIKQQPFDLLLIDIKMPGIDGLETAQAAKRIDPGIVCVTMTGYSTMDTVVKALSLGIDEFVIKPFAPEELSQPIAKALEKGRLRKENIRLRSLIPLFEFNRTLLSTVEIDAVLRHVLELAQAETRADLGIVYMHNSDGMSEYMRPTTDDETRSLRFDLASWVMERQCQLSLSRQEPVRQEFEELLAALDVEYLVAFPLVAKEGRSLGALIVGKQSEPFASGDSEFLQVMGGQAAIALENAHLFQEIQQACDELKNLDHLKSEFINIATHELRTPLAILLGYASMLEDEVTESERDKLHIIIRNAMRLRTLIDDMLNLSYLETGQMELELEEVTLSDVIQQAIIDMRPLAEGRSLQIEADIRPDLPPLLADRHKLDLVVMNLLSNAIKYTPDGGRITFESWTEGDKAVVAVRDTGIGIPSEALDKIFERFYQVEDSLTRQYGGTGLGLAIAKGMVEMWGGQIEVESEVGKGSTFTIELPLH